MIEHIPTNIEENKTSDFNEWLHAMKMVAYLPDGTPAEFRRKLWLALSEQYLSMKNIDWETEQVKYFCNNTSQEDDENLGDQIIKDLHRTGSTLCSGPAGSINQAKLKRILEGYARWNPEVGYCQGFNMLGALILQVMDKEEMESMKVMVYLIEGIFPSGYFNGSLNGLQVDMAVFRELMLARLPKLAKHLQRLQGPVDERFCEPPLTNVFTIQWFITMFSTSLPFNSVLRIWDLVLIEGSGILLRTALAIWSILEDKILCSKSADEFYCKMGQLSADMLKGTIINSNSLITKIVEFGPIPQLEQLRNKHMNNIKSWAADRKNSSGTLDDDGDSDDEAEIPNKKTMGMRLVRRSSRVAITRKSLSENREKIAIDIPLLKKQYNRIKEHQRQAHIIISAAVSRQSLTSISSNTNILLDSKNTSLSNNIRHKTITNRAPPLSRRSQFKIVTSSANQQDNNSFSITKKISPKHKKKLIYNKNEHLEEDISSSMSTSSILSVGPKTLKHNDSSSFSDSDNNSSTSTSLCDEDDSDHTFNFESSMEASPLHKIQSNNYKFSELYKDSVISQFKETGESFDDASIQSLIYDNNTTLDSDKNQIDCSSNYSEENKILSEIFPNTDIDKKTNSCDNDIISKMEITDEDLYSQPITKNKNFTLTKISDNINLVDLPVKESILNTNIQFSVNESGVTNKYFERVNDIKTPTNINLDIFKFPQYDSIPISASVSSASNITTEVTENIDHVTINKTKSSDNFAQKQDTELEKNQGFDISSDPQTSDNFAKTSEQWQSELASRIIEENSRVLHRILNKDFTCDKSYNFDSVQSDKINEDNEPHTLVDNLNCPQETQKKEFMKSTIEVSKPFKKEIRDINSSDDNVGISKSIFQNKFSSIEVDKNSEAVMTSSKYLLNETIQLKNENEDYDYSTCYDTSILNKTKPDVENSIPDLVLSSPKYLPNETLQFKSENFDPGLRTCPSIVTSDDTSKISNSIEQCAMVTEDILQENITHKELFNSLLENKSNLSKSIDVSDCLMSLVKTDLDRKDSFQNFKDSNVLVENFIDNNEYLVPAKIQDTNLKDTNFSIDSSDCLMPLLKTDVDIKNSFQNCKESDVLVEKSCDNLHNDYLLPAKIQDTNLKETSFSIDASDSLMPFVKPDLDTIDSFQNFKDSSILVENPIDNLHNNYLLPAKIQDTNLKETNFSIDANDCLIPLVKTDLDIIDSFQNFKDSDILVEKSIDNLHNDYLLSPKIQDTNLKDTSVSNFSLWTAENTVNNEKKSPIITNALKDDEVKSPNINNYAVDISESITSSNESRIKLKYKQSESITSPNESSINLKYNQLDSKYITNKPETTGQKIEELIYLSKSCIDEITANSFDKSIIHQNNDIDINKDLNDDSLENPKPYKYEIVSNNKFEYADYDLKRKVEELSNEPSTSDFDEKLVEQDKEYDLLKESCLFTKNNDKNVLETSYNFDKELCKTEKLSNTYGNELKLKLNEEKLYTPSKITSYSNYLKENPEKVPMTDSKIINNIDDKDNKSPKLDNGYNDTYSKYLKDENINDRLLSIKNTIKSIDSLCDDSKYNKLIKKEDDYSIRSVCDRKELKHLPTYNFEEDNFLNEYKTRREEPYKFLNSTDTTTTNYNNFTIPKLEIRHTTVTSTLYDRILAQNEEKQYRLEKQSFDKSIYKDNNLTTLNISKTSSHSAENSPIKNKCETRNTKSDSKSCSNILLQLQNRT